MPPMLFALLGTMLWHILRSDVEGEPKAKEPLRFPVLGGSRFLKEIMAVNSPSIASAFVFNPFEHPICDAHYYPKIHSLLG